MNFRVDFANLNIEINTKYEYTYNLCKDYLTEGEPVFTVSPTDEQVDREIEISEFTPPRGYAESICTYRLISEEMPMYNRIIFHGAVISYKNNGYIFTAPSGTGKTTHISLWKKYIEGVDIVNGDKPLLQIENGKVIAYATPYAGKEGYQNHSSAEIKGICLIVRGNENRIRKVRAGEILTQLMNQLYLPEKPEATLKTLDLLDELVKTVPLYVLECDISEEAVKTSFEMLTGEKYED